MSRMSLPPGTYGCAQTRPDANRKIASDFIIRSLYTPARALACILSCMQPKPEKETPKDERTPTEEQVNMKDTVAQRSDKKGTKIEDLAGTGEQDSQGG